MLFAGIEESSTVLPPLPPPNTRRPGEPGAPGGPAVSRLSSGADLTKPSRAPPAALAVSDRAPRPPPAPDPDVSFTLSEDATVELVCSSARSGAAASATAAAPAAAPAVAAPILRRRLSTQNVAGKQGANRVAPRRHESAASPAATTC